MEFLRAEPIWLEDGGVPNVYANFYERFVSAGGGARLLVCADSHYAVYVNGQYAYAAQYADDPGLRVYDELDISSLVRPGENELRVAGYCTRTDSSVYRSGNAYVMFEVFEGEKSLCASGTATLCAPDPHYVSGKAPLITGQMGYTFSYDATRKESERRPAVSAGERPPLAPRPVKQCVLSERRAETLMTQGVYRESDAQEPFGCRMQRAFLAFRSLSDMKCDWKSRPRFPSGEGVSFESPDGDGLYFVFDLGRNEVGLLDVEISLDQSAEVLIGWGEHLDDLRVRSAVGSRSFMSRYVAKADRSRFFHPFRRIGARYIELFVRAHKATVHYAGVRPLAYPLPEGAALELEDALHHRIFDVCRRTLVMCMHEHYEDCPWREQALYAMDSRNQMLAGYYAFGEYEFPKASLRLLGRSLRPDGLLELCAPARVSVNIPSFSLMYVVETWEYLLFSGDEAFACETLPICKAIVDSATARVRENGLVPRHAGEDKWNFYEWSDELDGGALRTRDTDEDRYDAPLNAFLILALEAYAKLNDALSNADRAQSARAAAASIRESGRRAFFRADEGKFYTYLDENGLSGNSELTQALCLLAGMCPEDCLAAALKRLTDGRMIPVTLAYAVFKYDALLTLGEGYGDWVRRDIEAQWGGMLYQGATSFWETILGGDDFDRAGSLCHGWSAIPAYIYYAYGAGIRPAAPGWASVSVRKAEGLPRVLGARVRLPDGTVRDFARREVFE